MNKEICGICNKSMATWWYAPGYGDGSSPYSCDDCVHRGCECNHKHADVNAYWPPMEEPYLPTEEDLPYKWIEEDKVWTHVDDKGREYPCSEYFHEIDGFDVDDEEPIKTIYQKSIKEDGHTDDNITSK